MFESHLLSTNYEPGTVFGAKIHRKANHGCGPQRVQILQKKKPYLGQIRRVAMSGLLRRNRSD